MNSMDAGSGGTEALGLDGRGVPTAGGDRATVVGAADGEEVVGSCRGSALVGVQDARTNSVIATMRTVVTAAMLGPSGRVP